MYADIRVRKYPLVVEDRTIRDDGLRPLKRCTSTDANCPLTQPTWKEGTSYLMLTLHPKEAHQNMSKLCFKRRCTKRWARWPPKSQKARRFSRLAEGSLWGKISLTCTNPSHVGSSFISWRNPTEETFKWFLEVYGAKAKLVRVLPSHG